MIDAAARDSTTAATSPRRGCTRPARWRPRAAGRGRLAAPEALALAAAVGQAALVDEAEALMAGMPVTPLERVAPLDAARFLGDGGAVPDAATLVGRAERALAALNTSNDVVLAAARP